MTKNTNAAKAEITKFLKFEPTPALESLPSRFVGYVNQMQRDDGCMLKMLGRGPFVGVNHDEVAVMIGKALPDGRFVRTSFGIPEDQGDDLYMRGEAYRRDLAKQIFAMPPREREIWFWLKGWRRRGGRLVALSDERDGAKAAP